MRYKYIAVEGIIGAGKTTLANYLAKELKATLVTEQFGENPRLPDFYTEPGKYALEVESFFLEQRYKQLSTTDLSQPVVADYAFLKCLVFGNITLPSDTKKRFEKLFREKYAQLKIPDLILYLLTSPEKAKQQILERGRAYEKQIETSYLEKLQQGYLDLFRELPDHRLVLVDTQATAPLKINDFYARIIHVQRQDFPLGINRIFL